VARQTLFTHPKFQRLVYTLGLSRATVLGHLELMWNVGYASGEAVLGDEIDVELAAEWTGERGTWTRALCDVKLLDLIDGRYAIHDLHDHAPRYVKDRWTKEQQRKSLRAADKRRTGGGQTADKRRRVVDKSATPSPAPSPAPSPSPAPAPTHPPAAASAPVRRVTRDGLAGNHHLCDHATWAACERGVCVPTRVALEWRKQCAIAGDDADAVIKAVLAWHLERMTSPYVGTDGFVFWREAWREYHAQKTKPRGVPDAKATLAYIRGEAASL
jgi:hypothetical protein